MDFCLQKIMVFRSLSGLLLDNDEFGSVVVLKEDVSQWKIVSCMSLYYKLYKHFFKTKLLFRRLVNILTCMNFILVFMCNRLNMVT